MTRHPAFILKAALLALCLTAADTAMARDPSAQALLELPNAPSPSIPEAPSPAASGVATPVSVMPRPVAPVPAAAAHALITLPSPPTASFIPQNSVAAGGVKPLPSATGDVSSPASVPPSLPVPPVKSAVLPPPAASGTLLPLGSGPMALPEGLNLSDINPFTKNPGILFAPVHLGGSLMYSRREMKLIDQFMLAYDNFEHQDKAEPPEDDDLTSLLGTLKSPGRLAPEATPAPLPNLYLGSIVYYSPSYWSIWLNGRKIVNSRNVPQNSFFVSRISRDEIELVWRPASLLDEPVLWRQATDHGKYPIPNIDVDEHAGKITLRMRPNQTFMPRKLAIGEGLIRPNYEPAVSIAEPFPAPHAP